MDFCSGGSAADLIKNLNYENIIKRKREEFELSLSKQSDLSITTDDFNHEKDFKMPILEEDVISYILFYTLKAVAYLHCNSFIFIEKSRFLPSFSSLSFFPQVLTCFFSKQLGYCIEI